MLSKPFLIPPNGSNPSCAWASIPVGTSLPRHSSLFILFLYNKPDSFQRLSAGREQKGVQEPILGSWKFISTSSHYPFPWCCWIFNLQCLTLNPHSWFICPGPLPSPRPMTWLAPTHLDGTVGRRFWPWPPITFTLVGGRGSAHALPGFCHQGSRIRQAYNLYSFYTFSPPL